jgi:hypothetical protein
VGVITPNVLNVLEDGIQKKHREQKTERTEVQKEEASTAD